jgi:hypothetical protein
MRRPSPPRQVGVHVLADVLRRQVADLDRRIAEMRTLWDELRVLEGRAAVTTEPGTLCGVIAHARPEIATGIDSRQEATVQETSGECTSVWRTTQ